MFIVCLSHRETDTLPRYQRGESMLAVSSSFLVFATSLQNTLFALLRLVHLRWVPMLDIRAAGKVVWLQPRGLGGERV